MNTNSRFPRKHKHNLNCRSVILQLTLITQLIRWGTKQIWQSQSARKKVNQSIAGINDQSKFAGMCSIEQIQRAFNSITYQLTLIDQLVLLRTFNKIVFLQGKKQTQSDEGIIVQRQGFNNVSRECTRSSKFHERSFNNSRTVNSP